MSGQRVGREGGEVKLGRISGSKRDLQNEPVGCFDGVCDPAYFCHSICPLGDLAGLPNAALMFLCDLGKILNFSESL